MGGSHKRPRNKHRCAFLHFRTHQSSGYQNLPEEAPGILRPLVQDLFLQCSRLLQRYNDGLPLLPLAHTGHTYEVHPHPGVFFSKMHICGATGDFFSRMQPDCHIQTLELRCRKDLPDGWRYSFWLLRRIQPVLHWRRKQRIRYWKTVCIHYTDFQRLLFGSSGSGFPVKQYNFHESAGSHCRFRHGLQGNGHLHCWTW